MNYLKISAALHALLTFHVTADVQIQPLQNSMVCKTREEVQCKNCDSVRQLWPELRSVFIMNEKSSLQLHDDRPHPLCN